MYRMNGFDALSILRQNNPFYLKIPLDLAKGEYLDKATRVTLNNKFTNSLRMYIGSEDEEKCGIKALKNFKSIEHMELLKIKRYQCSQNIWEELSENNS